MTNEPSNHIESAASWTVEATINLEPTSPLNTCASERSHPLCPGMNAASILWSGADRFGWEARAVNGGGLGGPGWLGAGVAAVPTRRLEMIGWTSGGHSVETKNLVFTVRLFSNSVSKTKNRK